MTNNPPYMYWKSNDKTYSDKKEMIWKEIIIDIFWMLNLPNFTILKIRFICKIKFFNCIV